MAEPDHGDDAASPDGGEPIYVNHCSVSLSLTTAELDFGQTSQADQSVRVKSRLVTSPAYFRHMGELIRSECERYDASIDPSRKNGAS